ncbi:hypothetical protein MHU86_10944 [Fragilaria crotonensis]|nr:hypothetical protein MHU86_10944 [Fragilaria crotonensis]
MKIILSSFIAIGLAVDSVAAVYLRNAPSKADLATNNVGVEDGEVYGISSMSVVIESEEVLPGDAAALDATFAFKYKTYWRCRGCNPDNSDPPALFLTKREQQELAMLAYMQSSECEAFHTVNTVKIYDAASVEDSASIRIPRTSAESKVTAQVAKIVDVAANNVGVEDGEVLIEIDNADAEPTPLCRLILMDAFNDSYDQVYGISSMSVVIESEEVIPGDAAALDATFAFKYKTYWRCRGCNPDNSDPPALFLTKREQQELAMLAYMQSSECEAFHTVNTVKIYDAASVEDSASIRIPRTSAEKSKVTAQVAKIVDVAANNVGVEDGEVMIEIDNADAEPTPLCRLILMDAFNDSYDQVYGISSMSVVIESEEVLPGDAAALDATFAFKYKTYWRCRGCNPDNSDPPALFLTKREQQELAMLAYMQSSECEAFHTVNTVKIYDAASVEDSASIRIPRTSAESKVTAQVAKIVDVAANNVGVEDGEVMIEIDNADAEPTPLCRLILMDAFNDSYDQVYGISSMSVVIESEEVIPGDAAALDATFAFKYKTYWRCRGCNPDNSDPPALFLTKREQQELAMLAYMQSSECEAFHTVNTVKIYDANFGVKSASMSE